MALKNDKVFLEELLKDKETKERFFEKIGDVLVFKKDEFVDYLSDKHFLADSYTKYKNKIGLNISNKFLNERGEVALVWPFKDCVLEGGQTKDEEKRKERFFNAILAKDQIDQLFSPKVLTRATRFVFPEKRTESLLLKRDENETIKENLVIKGNNLLALHTLKTKFQ
ncbi:site-specific DNA-methyltransferase, partial [Candidatus Gribaldobacteria bacterium]|nr:site-specific DNA-methyltransferase [Candidatus Gribaldobacteria bacterium]